MSPEQQHDILEAAMWHEVADIDPAIAEFAQEQRRIILHRLGMISVVATNDNN